MDLNQYQNKSRATALYPNVGKNKIYPTLGLVGEAGEVADKVKKVLRDKDGVFDSFERAAIKTAMEGDFDTGNVRYKARERYSFGWSDWRGIFGSEGA